MTGPTIAKCRGCGADIIWIKLRGSGKKMSIDAETHWIRLDYHGHPFFRIDGEEIFGEIAGDADDDPDSNFVEAHESHFATCPQGGKFRKQRKPREREQWKPIF